jgi:SAM-dependent methyltransferase
VRARLSRLLERLHLLGFAAALWSEAEYLRARARARGVAAPQADDGLPLPPRRLIYLVSHTADPAWYLDGGRAAAESLQALLARRGTSLETRRAILDFGCGCGRVIRRLRPLEASLAGSDLNADAVAWCSASLPFARFAANGLAPPLPFDDDEFDLVYALSVFTHLPEELGHAWIEELARVLRPGGLLALSTHGDRYRERLDAPERARYDAGDLVVRRPAIAGSNLCTAFHPPRYVRERLAGPLRVLDHVPEGARGNPEQDLWLLERDCRGGAWSAGR